MRTSNGIALKISLKGRERNFNGLNLKNAPKGTPIRVPKTEE